MAGHSKWAQIKRQKGSEDAKRSKVFSKLSRLISSESQRAGGDINSPGLRTIIEKAKKENMPKDVIERAVTKGTGGESSELFHALYEGFGPGGSALLIEGLTDNKNRASQEIRHVLSLHKGNLAGVGAASWAFVKKDSTWEPTTTVELNDTDGQELSVLIEELEEMDDIQNVYTNGI